MSAEVKTLAMRVNIQTATLFLLAAAVYGLLYLYSKADGRIRVIEVRAKKERMHRAIEDS